MEKPEYTWEATLNDNTVIKQFKGNKETSFLDVEKAMIATKSNSGAARFLGLDYRTYKKYASLYTDKEGRNLFEKHKNQSGKNIPKPKMRLRFEKFNLDDVLNNMHPGYPLQRLKDRLLYNGYLEPVCEQCGFNEKRITDGKVPLVLSFKEEKDNYNLDNLTMLCLNCHFLTVGNILGRKSEIKYFIKNYKE